MNIQHLSLFVILLFFAYTNYSMEIKKESEFASKALFNAIKSYNVDECKKLLAAHKNLAHIPCLIEVLKKNEKESEFLSFYPLQYIIYLENDTFDFNRLFYASEKYDNDKLSTITLIIDKITDIECLATSFALILNKIAAKHYIITNATIETFKQILKKRALLNIFHYSSRFSKTDDQTEKHVIAYGSFAGEIWSYLFTVEEYKKSKREQEFFNVLTEFVTDEASHNPFTTSEI